MRYPILFNLGLIKLMDAQVSVEDKARCVRIDDLRSVPEVVRFLSVEPLLEDLGQINLDGVNWVIVGGESGSFARHIQYEWVCSVRDQCLRSGVPFFFKQWGGVQKKRNGRVLDGRTWNGMPEDYLLEMAVR